MRAQPNERVGRVGTEERGMGSVSTEKSETNRGKQTLSGPRTSQRAWGYGYLIRGGSSNNTYCVGIMYSTTKLPCPFWKRAISANTSVMVAPRHFAHDSMAPRAHRVSIGEQSRNPCE